MVCVCVCGCVSYLARAGVGKTFLTDGMKTLPDVDNTAITLRALNGDRLKKQNVPPARYWYVRPLTPHIKANIAWLASPVHCGCWMHALTPVAARLLGGMALACSTC